MRASGLIGVGFVLGLAAGVTQAGGQHGDRSRGQAGGHEEDYPRERMSGEDIQRCLMFDEWWVAAMDRTGRRFNIEILPNGRFQAANLTGGGAMVGQWRVDLPVDRLCLRWDQTNAGGDGCYAVWHTGTLTYELIDPHTRAVVWWFVVSDDIH